MATFPPRWLQTPCVLRLREPNPIPRSLTSSVARRALPCGLHRPRGCPGAPVLRRVYQSARRARISRSRRRVSGDASMIQNAFGRQVGPSCDGSGLFAVACSVSALCPAPLSPEPSYAFPVTGERLARVTSRAPSFAFRRRPAVREEDASSPTFATNLRHEHPWPVRIQSRSACADRDPPSSFLPSPRSPRFREGP